MFDKEKTFRIGIDKISLYNFELKTNKSFKKLIETKENVLKEKNIISDEFFSLISSYTLFEDNSEIRESYYNNITFNPNVLLTGNNICNSSTEDLKKSLEILTNILREKDIFIDFSEAKIADIEININIPIDFNEYTEVFLLFFRQLRNSKAINAIVNTEKFSETKIEESYFSRLNKNITFKVYSKTREKNLDVDITRMEYFIETSAYEYSLKKYGKDNYLRTLLDNPGILKDIFLNRVKKDFLIKSISFIENNIKPVLEREYLAFKNANRLARKIGRKEERNVYRYLEKFWIFDYSFLIDLIKEYDPYHKSRETKTIIKKWSHYNNLKKLNYLEDFIFNH